MSMTLTRTSFLAAALLAGMWAPLPSHADDAVTPVSSKRSFLAFSGVRSLGRLTRTQMIGKAPMYVTAGIRVYVPAQEGLSKETLGALVRAEASGSSQGPLATEKLKIRVKSSESGYIVELTAPSTADAQRLVADVEAAL